MGEGIESSIYTYCKNGQGHVGPEVGLKPSSGFSAVIRAAITCLLTVSPSRIQTYESSA